MGKTKTKSRSVGDSPKPPITIRSTNVKILDDNIAKLEKAIQAGDVSANPSGTAEETLLSTIGIDGKKYELGPSAENTSYDNTDSGLTADDVQSAINETYGYIKKSSLSATRFFIARPKGVANFEAVIPLVKKPTAATVTNLKYFDGANWNSLSNIEVNAMDNALTIACDVPQGVTEGLIYWGQAEISLTY